MTKNVGDKPNVKQKRRPHVNRGSSLKKRARRPTIKHDLPRAQNGRMAAHMWDVSQDAEDPEKLSKTAGRVYRCGERFERNGECVTRLCGNTRLCIYCARVAAWKYAIQIAAKALILLRRNPRLRFWFATLLVPPGAGLRPQFERIQNAMRRVRRRESGQWRRTEGAVLQIHFDRGRDPLLRRPHPHILIAADPRAGFDSKELLLDWAECAYDLTPRHVAGRPDSRLLSTSSRQDIRLLGSLKGVGGTAPVDSRSFVRQFVSDVFNTVSYGGKPGSLSSEERLDVSRNAGRQRVPYGQFRAPHITAEELEATEEEVRVLLEEREKRPLTPDVDYRAESA